MAEPQSTTSDGDNPLAALAHILQAVTAQVPDYPLTEDVGYVNPPALGGGQWSYDPRGLYSSQPWTLRDLAELAVPQSGGDVAAEVLGGPAMKAGGTLLGALAGKLGPVLASVPFIPVPASKRVGELAARILERDAAKHLTKAEAEKLATRSGIGEIVQRERISNKRMRSDRGLTEAVAAIGTFTGKRGGGSHHPFIEAWRDPWGGRQVLESSLTQTPERESRIIDMMAKEGLPIAPHENYYTWRTPEALRVNLAEHVRDAPRAPTIEDIRMTGMRGHGAPSIHPELTAGVATGAQRRVARPMDIDYQEIDNLLSAIAQAVKEAK